MTAKLIVSPAVAAAIAFRSEPGPLSFKVVTSRSGQLPREHYGQEITMFFIR